jgi:hypothetical protein
MAGGRKNFTASKNKHKYMPDSHDKILGRSDYHTLQNLSSNTIVKSCQIPNDIMFENWRFGYDISQGMKSNTKFALNSGPKFRANSTRGVMGIWSLFSKERNQIGVGIPK